MRKILLAMSAIGASLALAAPAHAEGRAEARGGVFWGYGDSEATAGIALGYDWDLGDSAFVGVEASGDKILAAGYKISFGATGRVGIKAGESTKIFAAGGYTTEPCDGCEDAWHAGAGIQQAISGGVYIKAEYRHFFVDGFDDSDAVVGGVGVAF